MVTFSRGCVPKAGELRLLAPDAFQAGALAGELLAKLMGGKGRALSFPGPSEKHHLAQRERGFLAEFAKHPQCTVVASSLRVLTLTETLPERLLDDLRSAERRVCGQ